MYLHNRAGERCVLKEGSRDRFQHQLTVKISKMKVLCFDNNFLRILRKLLIRKIIFLCFEVEHTKEALYKNNKINNSQKYGKYLISTILYIISK